MTIFLNTLLVISMILVLFYNYASSTVWLISLATILLVFTKASGLTTFIIAWSLFLVLILLMSPPFRRRFISKYIFNWFKKIKPSMSKTETEALEAGTVTWEADLFSGMPDFKKLLALPANTVSDEEQKFIDNETNVLCSMLNEWDITHNLLDLPENVWSYMKQQVFFGLIIPKAYGGRQFSSFAVSRILIKLYSKSISCASTVSVPNSLGPAELLLKYGTEKQKDYYLPRLAKGLEVPCFALTGPNAGSDAASLPDVGVVCYQKLKGDKVLGLKLNWDKRYITLAPVATIIGLAFRMLDPEKLLGGALDLGITCALIPVKTKGVVTDRRHFPLNTAFMNGPTQGNDVFIPLDYIIGGVEMAGHGWRMLMECLSAGRAVSLPASAVGGAKVAAFGVGAYARIRKQFNTSISNFEGIEEPLTRIAGETYILDAATAMTLANIDRGEESAVASAILKYHTTEGARRIASDAMDVSGGKGICLGPQNYLGRAYQNVPIGITVEGANILTRCLIIFGQGAILCHPYLLDELQSVDENNLVKFDKAFFAHVGHFISNACRALLLSVTDGKIIRYHKDPLKKPIQLISRYSSNLAFIADFSMFVFGADLKLREKISGRLADLLSMLYLTSAVIKKFHDDCRPHEDLALVEWSYTNLLFKYEEAMAELIDNMPRRSYKILLKGILLASGRKRKRPSDQLGKKVAKILTTKNSCRDRLSEGLYLENTDGNVLAEMEQAFLLIINCQDLEIKISKAVKKGLLNSLTLLEQIDEALEKALITTDEAKQLKNAETARQKVIAVDDFSTEELLNNISN